MPSAPGIPPHFPRSWGCCISQLGIISEALEKSLEVICRVVSGCSSFERFGFGKCLLFQFKIGMEVNLSGFHGFMAQP